jgi:Carboxypeptidase regulatory-like domain
VIVSAATDSDGRFSLQGAEPGLYTIRVSGAGIFAAELVSVPIPGDDLPIVVARKVSITGVVTERGQPVSGATVEVTGDAIGGTARLVTGVTGAFALPELPEGTYEVGAYRNDLAAATQHLTRLGSGPFSPIALPLETAAVVLGRVFEREAGDGASGSPDQGRGVVAAIELRPFADDEPARYAQSGADGRFRIEGVHTGRWIVSAIAPGYVLPEPVEIEAGRGVVELGVVAGGTIEGRVVDSAGKPVAGAELRALGGPGSASSVDLSGDREAALLASFGGRTVAAAATWDAESAARQDPRFVPRGELGVLLGPLPAIPPLGARAARHAMLDPSSLPPELAQLMRPPTFAVPPSAASQWTTDAEGKFRLRGLPSGRYTVRARAPGYAEGQRPGIAVAPGAAVRDVQISLSVGTFLVGTIRNQRGELVIGAKLVASAPGTAAAVSSPGAAGSAFGAAAPDAIEARSNGDGSYRVGPLLGPVVLEVSAEGHGPIHRRLELPGVPGSIAAERREDLTLTVYDAVLRGTVDDARGAPVGAARISVAQGPAQGRSAASAEDGSFSISQLPTGSLRLLVEHAEFPPFQVTVDVAAPARLSLPFGGGIEGRMLDATGGPAGGVRFTATGPSTSTTPAPSIDLTTARDGTWKLLALRPGTWQLAVRRSGNLPLTRTVAVPAGDRRGQITVRDLVLALARGGSLAGTIRDRRGSRLPNALVVARSSDGTTCESRSDANGEFRLRDCPTGDLELSAEQAGARISTQLFLRPSQEIVTLVLEVPTP